MPQEPTSPLSPQQALEALLEGSILPSPNTIELLRTAAADYRLRFGSGDSHIAELFQENTKLSPHTTHYDADAAAALARATTWYLSTAYRVQDDHLVADNADAVRPPVDALPPRLARVLEPFTQEGPLSSLLYGLDLFLLHEQALLRVAPRRGFLWRDRRMAAGDASRIRESIIAKSVPDAGPLLFVVAAPWRYMIFLGPRGYRRMLLDAGELLARLRDGAADAGGGATVFLDFYDRRVDDILLFDGTERTVIAIVALDGEKS